MTSGVDYQNSNERAYGPGFTVPKPAGSVKITPDYHMYNCRISTEAAIMNVVTYQMASGAKVFSGSTYAYGCFVNKSCPTAWQEGAVFTPLSISDADSTNAAKIIDNVLAWAKDEL